MTQQKNQTPCSDEPRTTVRAAGQNVQEKKPCAFKLVLSYEIIKSTVLWELNAKVNFFTSESVTHAILGTRADCIHSRENN